MKNANLPYDFGMGTEDHGSIFGIEMPVLLAELAKTRPIFHSEADFQHALAWKLHQEFPSIDVRLEFRLPLSERMYVDIWAKEADHVLAIELKYKTRRLATSVNGEPFELADHAAQDLGRYDTIKDICRLEALSRTNLKLAAYVVLLTNDSAYWHSPGAKETVYGAFRLSEGRELRGELAWGAAAGGGTIKSRERALVLSGSYAAKWRDYSTVATKSYGQFKYLLARIC